MEPIWFPKASGKGLEIKSWRKPVIFRRRSCSLNFRYQIRSIIGLDDGSTPKQVAIAYAEKHKKAHPMLDIDDRLRTVFNRYETRRTQERTGENRPPSQRMFAIGPEAGRLLNLLARSIETPRILEIGTSFGYSGLWLAEAARSRGGHVLTLESEAHKSDHARQEAEAAGLSGWITHRTGDAVALIPALEGPFDMIFLDLWKDLYVPCLDAFAPKLAPGALVVADNMGRGGGEGTRAYGERLRSDTRFSTVMVPVGSGMEISRFAPAP